ncbi:flagellar hook-associated protein FlgL [Paenibacillus sp.]|uniref:flagellar hook-associated protein FlgL n=1 Tax=Paenibacillus sp. TaxID=58172 RepID=UPI002D71C85D|nr:flagellar hook-associated protein FlgL [Paenibacillus sp.]HZG87388.1 flagellar hook-associated protein FlgL [Paenibacillus sp.]
MVGRVTQGMINSQFMRSYNYNLAQMTKYQEQINTGRVINKPSDNPVGISFALRYRAEISIHEKYQENIDTATSWLEYTDTMLDQTNQILQRVRELTVNGSTGSNPQSALDAIKAEILELTKQLTTIGNSQFNGKYVFNGQLTDVPPYSAAVSEGRPATSGFSQGNVDVSSAVLTSSNNALDLIVDGQTVSVTIPPFDYTTLGDAGAEQLAADLQSRINAATATTDVTVTVGKNNQLRIASNSAGTTSSVQVTGGSFAIAWLSAAGDLSDLEETAGFAASDAGVFIQAQSARTDKGGIEFEIGTGVNIAVNITGDAVFGAPEENDNLFRVMNDIYNALDAGDTAKVSDLLGNLDQRMNKFLAVRADVGAKMNRTELASERMKDINYNLTTLQANIENADMAELITTLKTFENVYQASLSIGSRIISQSLVDFLR